MHLRRVTTTLAAVAVLTGCGAAAATSSPRSSERVQPVPGAHVAVLVLENHELPQVLGSKDAPYLNRLAKKYAVATDYRGVAHPSLPNYVALVTGSTHGITSDCAAVDCPVPGPSLVDQLEARKLFWRAYMEGLPRAGWTGAASGRYVKRHVPFLYFRRVLAQPARLRNVVPLSALSRDLAAKRLPDFSLVVPDMCHDMHDCSVSTGDAWLARFLPPLLRSRQLANSVVFVIFDESDSADPGVAALALGPLVRPASVFTPAMSHYGLLRTIEDAWGLPRLGRSGRVAPVTGIWR
jgi:hypothetical protein